MRVEIAAVAGGSTRCGRLALFAFEWLVNPRTRWCGFRRLHILRVIGDKRGQ